MHLFQARVKEKDLEDENAREAIFDFIEKHPGGVDGAISDVEKDAKDAKQAKEAFIDWIGEDLLSGPKSTETKQEDCQKQSDRETSFQEHVAPFPAPDECKTSTPEPPSLSTMSSAPTTPTPPTPTSSTASNPTGLTTSTSSRPASSTTSTPSKPTSSTALTSFSTGTPEASPRKALLDAITRGAPLRPVVARQEKKEEDLGIWGPLAQAIKERGAACNGSNLEYGWDLKIANTKKL